MVTGGCYVKHKPTAIRCLNRFGVQQECLCISEGESKQRNWIKNPFLENIFCTHTVNTAKMSCNYLKCIMILSLWWFSWCSSLPVVIFREVPLDQISKRMWSLLRCISNKLHSAWALLPREQIQTVCAPKCCKTLNGTQKRNHMAFFESTSILNPRGLNELEYNR